MWQAVSVVIPGLWISAYKILKICLKKIIKTKSLKNLINMIKNCNSGESSDFKKTKQKLNYKVHKRYGNKKKH